MPASLRRRSNPISASTADNQHFIIILTNHPDILRDHTVFRIQVSHRNMLSTYIRIYVYL